MGGTDIAATRKDAFKGRAGFVALLNLCYSGAIAGPTGHSSG